MAATGAAAVPSHAQLAGGVDEAPPESSRRRDMDNEGHSRSASTTTSPSALDKFMRALLPQSSFPSHIAHHPAAGEVEVDGSGAAASGGIGQQPSSIRPGLSRTSSASSSASTRRYTDSQAGPASPASSPLGKSRNRVPRSTLGAGKAAHQHRHNLSIDSGIASPMTTNAITRTRSRTAVSNARAPSPASFYAGGIGESPTPANRSRQNSSSSVASNTIASSMFSHRPSGSSATQQDGHILKNSNKTGSSRLNSSSTANTTVITSPTTATSNTLPSIRGYTTFPDSLNLSSARPRTPLLDPFMRYRPGHPSGSDGINDTSRTGNEPPRLGVPSDEPAPSNSYVAALALAPLVSRPTQGGQALYVPAGRAPDTPHAAPSSTYSTPALYSSPSMHFTGSNHTGNMRTVATEGGGASRTRTLDSNAGLGFAPASGSRPGLRHRSSSVDSYLRHEQEEEAREHGRHNRQQSSGHGGLSSFFHLRSSNSEDKTGVLGLGRRRSSKDRTKSRSRKGSLSNTVTTSQSAKFSSRFVHYGQPSPASRPHTPNSEPRPRQRSSSFGATISQAQYASRFPERDSPTHPGIGSSSNTRGRLPRSYNPSRSNSAATASSSVARRREEEQKRIRNKLISARLPRDVHHKDARLPSQPLGYTWICGAHSAARTPSFYEEFDYASFPGGKRKRSMSRSTITQRNYSTPGGGTANASRRGSDDLAYESEPEFLARARARNANAQAMGTGPSRSRDHLMVDEQTQTTPQANTPSGNEKLPQLSLSGGLLTNQEEQKALRRRSQSLVNLRRATSQNSNTRKDNNNIMISHPFREQSTEFVRTPRAAPVPFPEDDIDGLDSGVPPLFMGESAVVPSPANRRGGYEERYTSPAASNGMAGVGTGAGLASSVRRAPSRASIEAIDDPEKRREALFAALPPPARRSPTPASALSPTMYTTGKAVSPELPPAQTTSTLPHHGYVDYPSRESEELLNVNGNRSGTISPPVDDYSQFEASRVIIGQSDLLSSATAQERFPIVYGQAFSTTHESHEGEILNASASADDLSGLQRHYSRESEVSRDSLTPLRDVETVQQMRQDTSGSGGSGSATRSISNGSARILDLNEESFTNLFFKAPPPSKPLPSLPSSSPNQSTSNGGSGSRIASTPSPARVSPNHSPSNMLGYNNQRPDSMTPSDRFPTPDFSVLNTFDLNDVTPNLGEDGSKRDSRRDTFTHPFARVASGHPSGSRGPLDDWSNIDESLLREGRQVWPPTRYEDEENETLLPPPPPPMARNFTSSTSRTIHTFYTVGGGPSNASTSAFNAPSLNHQESFASARSHITPSSAARMPQAEIGQPLSFLQFQDRGQFIDDDSDDEHDADDEDLMATIRRTDLSPIFVPRSGIPPQFLRQSDRDDLSSPATAVTTQPSSAKASDDEIIQSNRGSFIEFETVVAIRPRAASDTRSFIDDDSDDEDGGRGTTEPGVGPYSAENNKINRPSVIVEHHEEDEQGSQTNDGLSPAQATSSYSPLYTGPTTSPSHYSVTPSDIIDTYRNHESSGMLSRDSQGNFALALPNTPKGGDRSSGGSHAHSVSNVSILSSLSRLEDFPEPPPSVTPAYEKDEDSAMMQHQPSNSTLGNRDASSNTLRPRGSSLPGGPHNQSRATINTQNTQTTSIYTFSSSAEGSGQTGEASRDDVDDEGRSSNEPAAVARPASPSKRMFEFPIRRGSSKRTTVDSFLDTTASPERGSRTSPSLASFDRKLGFPSSSTAPGLASPTGADYNDKYTPSPSQQSFRLSGIFARGRPKHERTSSDPSALNFSRTSSLNMSRRDSGGFENQEEKRQSWKGF